MDGGLHQHRSRQRISSRGFDPLLNGIGLPGTPSADMLASGLRVPYAPTGGVAPTLVQQFLFQLCSIGIGDGLWLTNLGQLSVLGSEQPVIGDTPNPIFPNVIEQTSAAFRFADCHPIRWGVRRVPKPRTQWAAQNVLSADSFCWRWSDNPALLFETAIFPPTNLNLNGTPDNYLALTSYTSPGGGVFPGEPVGGDLGCFDSLDFPWSSPGSKAFEPVWVRPGGQLVFYALVDQTNPATRAKIQIPAGFPVPTTGMPENAFIADFTSTIQFAVGGMMEVERRSGKAAA